MCRLIRSQSAGEHESARVQIDDDRQAQPALVGANMRDVADPGFVSLYFTNRLSGFRSVYAYTQYARIEDPKPQRQEGHRRYKVSGSTRNQTDTAKVDGDNAERHPNLERDQLSKCKGGQHTEQQWD